MSKAHMVNIMPSPLELLLGEMPSLELPFHFPEKDIEDSMSSFNPVLCCISEDLFSGSNESSQSSSNNPSFRTSPLSHVDKHSNVLSNCQMTNYSQASEFLTPAAKNLKYFANDDIKISDSPDSHFKKALELIKKTGLKSKSKNKPRKSSLPGDSEKKGIQRKCSLQNIPFTLGENSPPQSDSSQPKKSTVRNRVRLEAAEVDDLEFVPWKNRDMPSSFFSPPSCKDTSTLHPTTSDGSPVCAEAKEFSSHDLSETSVFNCTTNSSPICDLNLTASSSSFGSNYGVFNDVLLSSFSPDLYRNFLAVDYSNASSL